MSAGRPDDLFEAEMVDGRKLVVRAGAVAAIVPVLERPGQSMLIVGGREFAIVGEIDEIAQALLPS